MSTLDVVWIDEIGDLKRVSDLLRMRSERNGQQMAAKVRALSHRVPLFVRFGDRGFTYSISGWHGVV